jgi:6-phosphogluconate dehydrogenase
MQFGRYASNSSLLHLEEWRGRNMTQRGYEIGMMGLGASGRTLALNMLDHGYSVAVYSEDFQEARALEDQVESRGLRATRTPDELVRLLRSPRAILLPQQRRRDLEMQIARVSPRLRRGDVLVDTSDSHFRDTDVRASALAEDGIQFLGVGVSGREDELRHGPSLMLGGTWAGYERVRPIFEAIAARVDTEPCVAWLGPGSAGHFVKMVHDGIACALFELVAETHALMKRALGLPDSRVRAIYERWNQSELNSRLLAMSVQALHQVREGTGDVLQQVLLKEASQATMAAWNLQCAIDLRVAIPTIDAAVSAQGIERNAEEQLAATHVLGRQEVTLQDRPEPVIDHIRGALYAAMVLTFAQGMALLRAASETYSYGLDLAEVARIWRGGSTVRTIPLEEIRNAYRAQPDLLNLLLDSALAHPVMRRQEDLRTVVHMAVRSATPAPAMMASIAYLDDYRSMRPGREHVSSEAVVLMH